MFGGGHDHTIEGGRFLKTMTPKKQLLITHKGPHSLTLDKCHAAG